MTQQSNKLKEEGNTHFREGRYGRAVACFSEALTMDPTNHLLFSNRSAAYTSMKRFDLGLQDANKCIDLDPKFAKGYMRRGAALRGFGQFGEAIKAYREAYKDDLNNPDFIKRQKEIESDLNLCQQYKEKVREETREGNWEEALAIFDKAMLICPMDTGLQSARAACEANHLKLQKAKSVPLSMFGMLLKLRRVKLVRRWFRLEGDMFYYYESENAPQAKVSAKLLGAQVFDAVNTDFAIGGPHFPKPFRLRAASVEERERWCKSLSAAIAIANSKVIVTPVFSSINSPWAPWTKSSDTASA